MNIIVTDFNNIIYITDNITIRIYCIGIDFGNTHIIQPSLLSLLSLFINTLITYNPQRHHSSIDFDNILYNRYGL